MGKRPDYWNHNTAYYPWLARQAAGCIRVLDVGCGDGALARFLAEDGRRVTGIDPDGGCIRMAQKDVPQGVRFVQTRIEEFESTDPFDAVIFCASLHHTDAQRALRKAKSLLCRDGVLLIVGLAEPSTPADRMRDLLRTVPSKALTALHRFRPCEALGIPTVPDGAGMDFFRELIARELPGAKLRYGLHYRWLLEWRNGT